MDTSTPKETPKKLLHEESNDTEEQTEPEKETKPEKETEKPSKPARWGSEEPSEENNDEDNLLDTDPPEIDSELDIQPTAETTPPPLTEKPTNEDTPPTKAAEDVDLPSDIKESSKDQEALPTTTSFFSSITLSKIEKICLSTLAAIFLGLFIWGYVWLNAKNHQASTQQPLELPVSGKYATISAFSSSWVSSSSSGFKPSVTLTLDEKSSSGALRLYFRNTEKDIVGDPITVSFKEGKFIKNNQPTITVVSTKGFSLESDFHAYQLDRSLAWKVQILEAPSELSSSSEFTEIIHTVLSRSVD